jgi:hypothetical protein
MIGPKVLLHNHFGMIVLLDGLSEPVHFLHYFTFGLETLNMKLDLALKKLNKFFRI